jgi:hypothetical protein
LSREICTFYLLGQKPEPDSYAGGGGRTAAVVTSFITTCKRLGIDPLGYLRDIFERISTHPQSRLAELLPDQWRAASTS